MENNNFKRPDQQDIKQLGQQDPDKENRQDPEKETDQPTPEKPDSQKSGKQPDKNLHGDKKLHEDRGSHEELDHEADQKLKEAMDVARKNGLWERLKKIAKAFITVPVTYLIVKPVQWVGEKLTIAAMPKESKNRYYEEAIIRAAREYDEKQKNKTQENARTMTKKMEIISNEKYSEVEKLRELSNLCYKSGNHVTVKTQLGAFRFEKVGDTVLIKHATPMKRTLESKISYDMKTVGGVVYSRLGSIKEKETDIFDAAKQVVQDKGFDIHTRELDPESISDVGLIVEPIQDANLPETELGDEEKVNKEILQNGQADLNEVLKAIDTPDYAADNAILTGGEPVTEMKATGETIHPEMEPAAFPIGEEYFAEEPEYPDPAESTFGFYDAAEAHFQKQSQTYDAPENSEEVEFVWHDPEGDMQINTLAKAMEAAQIKSAASQLKNHDINSQREEEYVH